MHDMGEIMIRLYSLTLQQYLEHLKATPSKLKSHTRLIASERILILAVQLSSDLEKARNTLVLPVTRIIPMQNNALTNMNC